MDRLNPLDAVLVDAEDANPHTSMAIASIAIFEGPAPSHEEFLAHLAGRLARVPATGRSSARCPSAWGGRSGWTTRTSISATTCAAPRCPPPAETSS